MEPLSRTWSILASLPRSWLAFARSCIVTLPRSWQDYGKATKVLAMNMDLCKDTMASNTGCTDEAAVGGGSHLFKFTFVSFYQESRGKTMQDRTCSWRS